VTNDKSQGLMYGVFTNLLLSLPVKNFLNRCIFGKLQKTTGGGLTHFVRMATTLLEDEEFIGHLEYSMKQLLVYVYTQYCIEYTVQHCFVVF